VPVAFATHQVAWYQHLASQDWVQVIRSDGQQNLLRIAWTLALWAEWDSLETRPTWAELMHDSGLTARSVARWLLELRLRGWLELLEHGSTPTTRPMTMADLEGNRAALYGLRVPLTPQRAFAVAAELMMDQLATELSQLAPGPGSSSHRGGTAVEQTPGHPDRHAADQPELEFVDTNGTLPVTSRSFKERSTSGTSRARKPVDNSSHQASDQGKQNMTALRAGSEEHTLPDLLIMVPTSRYQMLACAHELRRQRPAVFGRCTRKLVRHLCKPFWQAGWCNHDILHALDHRPNMFAQLSPQLAMPVPLISPRQLIVGRLGAWRDEHGTVRPGWWTSHRAKATAVATGATRQLVRSRHGAAGARLLRTGDGHLSVERVIAHGKAARGPHTTPSATSASRATREQVHAEWVAKARAALARAPYRPENQPTALDQGVMSPAASAYERAVARAQAEGRPGQPRRVRRSRR
jgi:hypothetical protein